MKKLLLLFVLILGVFFVGSAKIGAKMSNEFSQVRAAHILVKTEKEAAELKAKIQAGEMKFEDAAAQYSQCPSGARGGDLGYFGRGMMVKEFEVPSFNEPVGTVTEPIQTQFGWHLIYVIDKK
jgi:peptidyl-prolyl cis-trans isomerase C